MRSSLYHYLILLIVGTVVPVTWAVPPPIRVMPVGDSITDGAGAPGGYRLPLYQLLTNAGFNVDFVGTLTDNSAPGLADPDHEGHSGWRIDQIDSIIQGVFDKIEDPDVILLLIGTNDYGQGYDTAHATNRLETLVAHMAAYRPYAKIIVANLLVRGEPYNTQIQTTFNPFLPGIVQRQRALGREVYFDDLRSAVPLSDLPDQLHPGATGYAKMATNWFGVITNLFTPQGSTNPPAISRAYGWFGLTNVTVVFSKPVADDAAVAGNFSLSGGLTVTGASLDTATQREITLTTSPQQPSTTYSITVNGVHDRTSAQLQIPPDTTVTFKSLAGRGATANVPEAADYQLVYSLDIPDAPNYSTGITYAIDRRAQISGFTRIAYYLELQQSGGPLNFVWASMDAFTTNVDLIGVPTLASSAFFQQSVSNMNVQSSVAGIVTGTDLTGGNIEFWPSNSSPANSAGVPNASGSAYDWGDSPSAGNYGCMQVHNHDARQVLFAFNRWGGVGGIADIGIGNRAGNYLDWIFAQNAATYLLKTLQVFVLPVPASLRINEARFDDNQHFRITWEAKPGATYAIWRKLALDSSLWFKVGTVTVTTTSATFTDPDPAVSAAFYQLELQ